MVRRFALISVDPLVTFLQLRLRRRTSSSEATSPHLLDSEWVSSHKTNVSVAYRITKDQREVWRAIETPDHLHQGGEQLTIERYLPVASLQPGRYTIEVIAIDLLANETITRTAEFTLKPAQRAKPGETPRPSPSGLL